MPYKNITTETLLISINKTIAELNKADAMIKQPRNKMKIKKDLAFWNAIKDRLEIRIKQES